MDHEYKPAVRYKKIMCRLIFDMKRYLMKKAQCVSVVPFTDPPSYITYASVIIQYILSIAFLIAVFNGLDILERDIHNAYLDADTKEKDLLLCWG